ncbi:MMPL family transporter [Streptomyces sp. TRM66268-LWL]|uniref:MMPL family transporter n=1 Tax=Streptomyces polyasparticus TaxID=2767826 RepID=A0ABR7SF10_9ACTN|nr:MMPL family transporter [Streptomyces polyasparticus]MBC9714003.1 MMPL family transporter [Streptomyces polyasparticus]
MLSALARVATRRPLTVILIWLLLLVAGFGLGTRVFGDLEGAVEVVEGSEAQRTEDLLDRLSTEGASIEAIVEARDPGALRPAIEQAAADVRKMAGVAAVPDPYGMPSQDGKALLIPVEFTHGLEDDDEEELAEEVAGRLHAIEDTTDATVHVSGGPLLGVQLGGQAQEDVASAEIISLPVVLIVLLLIFGGLRAAALPLVVTVCGVAGAFLALYGFSLVTDVSVYAVQVTTMLGLGLAVDYALLMVVRFREERAVSVGADSLERGSAPGREGSLADAVERTVAKAGRTVMFSGLTVAVCLTGLMVFPNLFLRSMGLAAAAVVVVDMLAAVTLLPALLTKFGGKIAPASPRKRLFGRTSEREPGHVFARLARFSARRPVAVTATVVAGLVLVALPATQMTMNLGDARQLKQGTEARELYDSVRAHYPEGTGVDPVSVVIMPNAGPECERRIRALPGIAHAESTRTSNGTVLLDLTPKGTVDGAQATGLVERIRDLRGAEPVHVTGNAAHMVDFRAMLAERAPWAVLIVLAGIFALLFAFTGSLLIPLRTILTTLLSLGAALGVVTWVFQDGHLAGWLGAEGLGALSLTAPPLIIAIAFGLAMDYELFILARMREEWLRSGDHRAAVVTGLRQSGRVVTCAAVLLAIVFGAFMTGSFSPILQIGLGLTLAVLIDATVVRMLLVPATMTLLGGRAWWAPRRMRRVYDRIGLKE